MTAEEAEAFEKQPDFEAIVEMRKWDDAAKLEDVPVDGNDFYKDLCRKILTAA
jgi:predicted HD phosphohydrolase